MIILVGQRTDGAEEGNENGQLEEDWQEGSKGVQANRASGCPVAMGKKGGRS